MVHPFECFKDQQSAVTCFPDFFWVRGHEIWEDTIFLINKADHDSELAQVHYDCDVDSFRWLYNHYNNLENAMHEAELVAFKKLTHVLEEKFDSMLKQMNQYLRLKGFQSLDEALRNSK